jgi:hypothetical protein
MPLCRNRSHKEHEVAYENHETVVYHLFPQNDISVNVLGFEDNEFFPLYISPVRRTKHEIDLLYLQTTLNDSHYCRKQYSMCLCRALLLLKGCKQDRQKWYVLCFGVVLDSNRFKFLIQQ